MPEEAEQPLEEEGELDQNKALTKREIAKQEKRQQKEQMKEQLKLMREEEAKKREA